MENSMAQMDVCVHIMFLAARTVYLFGSCTLNIVLLQLSQQVPNNSKSTIPSYIGNP